MMMNNFPRYGLRPFALAAAAVLLSVNTSIAGSTAPSHDMSGMNHASGAHGGSDGKTKFAFGEPGKPGRVDRTVSITMGDMNFDPAALQVNVGETVRFVVANKSETDHDFTIGDAKTQAAHRKEMAEALEKSGEMEHGGDPNAVLVKAGKTQELLWRFTRAGRVEFDCNLPGHYEAGMKGVVEVRQKAAG